MVLVELAVWFVVAKDEVSTTLLTEGLAAAAFSTASVPLTAGSTRSRCGSSTLRTSGLAVWITYSQPEKAERKDSGSPRSAATISIAGESSTSRAVSWRGPEPSFALYAQPPTGGERLASR